MDWLRLASTSALQDPGNHGRMDSMKLITAVYPGRHFPVMDQQGREENVTITLGIIPENVVHPGTHLYLGN